MMIDQFSKWVEYSAIPEQSTETVVLEFLIRFVATFGCPTEVHTDQGTNFESNLFKAFCSAMGTAKTRTSPYRSSSNGQIERQNRTILQIFRCMIKGNITNWDKDLPLALMAMHSTVQKSTGFTPNQVMLGRETIPPGELVLGTVDLNVSPTDPAS